MRPTMPPVKTPSTRPQRGSEPAFATAVMHVSQGQWNVCVLVVDLCARYALNGEGEYEHVY
jgi:hypothetical protein